MGGECRGEGKGEGGNKRTRTGKEVDNTGLYSGCPPPPCPPLCISRKIRIKIRNSISRRAKKPKCAEGRKAKSAGREGRKKAFHRKLYLKKKQQIIKGSESAGAGREGRKKAFHGKLELKKEIAFQ
jgi:hypothetical protein